jgi:hypothetical protein
VWLVHRVLEQLIERSGMLILNIDRVKQLVEGDQKDGEIPIMALRRRLIEGKVTKADLFKTRCFGTRSWRSLLELLDLEEGQVIASRPEGVVAAAA